MLRQRCARFLGNVGASLEITEILTFLPASASGQLQVGVRHVCHGSAYVPLPCGCVEVFCELETSLTQRLAFSAQSDRFSLPGGAGIMGSSVA